MPFRKGAAARLSLALFAVFALSALSPIPCLQYRDMVETIAGGVQRGEPL